MKQSIREFEVRATRVTTYSFGTQNRRWICAFAAGALTFVMVLASQTAMADEGGVSFWVPGTFGSLAAVPQQPGWSMADILYNTNVKASGDVALSREFEIGNVPLHFSGSASASVKADVPTDWVIPQYVFATPVLGGQAAVSLMGIYGRNDTTLAGTLNVTSPIMKSISIDRTDIMWGFGDLYPTVSLEPRREQLDGICGWGYPDRGLPIDPPGKYRHRAWRSGRRPRVYLSRSAGRP
jgi:hypothetical protein